MRNGAGRVAGLMLGCGMALSAQTAPIAAAAGKATESPAPPKVPGAVVPGTTGSLIGRDDELVVWAADIPDLSGNGGGKTVTVDAGGYINVPMAGRVHVQGMSATQVEEALVARLRKYLRYPQVNVTLMQIRSQPVSVMGAVNTPGIHQIRGHMALLELLAQAGGLRNDAGPTVTITRPIENGKLPLPMAEVDPTGKYTVAEVNLEAMMRGDHPEYNTKVLPNDVVAVRRAEMVYVVGEVTRAGGFVLNEKKTVSVLQALSLAGGLTATAAPGNARIIRGGPDGPEKRVEVAVNLKRILGGKDKDIPMNPEDILFIPDSTSKKLAIRTAEAVLQTVSGIMIFRGGRP
jgi:polysaccharide biosynthesis/export protein